MRMVVRAALLCLSAMTVVAEPDIREPPVWDLQKHGGARKVSLSNPVVVPNSAIPNSRAFTVYAKVRFAAVEEGHAVMLFDQILNETGFGFELVRENSWGNPAFLHVNGERYCSAYPVGRIKSDSTHEVMVTARRGWIVIYLDDMKLQGFILTVTPNLENIRVPGVIRPRWDTHHPWIEFPDLTLVDLKVWGDDVEYFSKGETRDPPSGFKGGKGWLVEIPTHPISGRPNVLCVGDSISDNYVPFLRKEMEGEANIYHYNTCFIRPGRDGVVCYSQRWREIGTLAHFDHIFVNNGLHSLDWTEERVSEAKIVESYLALFEIARLAGPRAAIHYLATTPFTAPRAEDGNVPGLGDANEVVMRLNRCAATAVNRQACDYVDLYSDLVAHLDFARGDRFHWMEDGSRLIARRIAERVRRSKREAKE